MPLRSLGRRADGSAPDRPADAQRVQGAATSDASPDAERVGVSPARPVLRWSAIAAVLAISALLFVVRRPDELAAPYLWDEEGEVVSRWLWHGWHTAFLPINGDLSVLTTGGIVLAGWAGWSVLPVIDYIMAVATFVVTAGLLLVPRSHFGALPVRALMVIYLAVVPVNPEVYGVMLYSFWWTSLWPVIALGWGGKSCWWRPVVVGLAAFNSLAAAVLALVYLPYAFYKRSRELAVSGGVLLVGLVAQLVAYFTSDRGSAPVHPIAILKQTGLNVTQFVVRPWYDPRPIPVLVEAGIGVLILLILLAAVLAFKDQRVREAGVGLWVAGILLSGLSAAPAPLISNPIFAGPRYYFLPFTLLGLLLIFLLGHALSAASIGSRPSVLAGTVAAVMLALGLSRLPEAGVLVRHSDHMNWRAAIERCADSKREAVSVPIQFDGMRARALHVLMPSESCRILADR